MKEWGFDVLIFLIFLNYPMKMKLFELIETNLIFIGYLKMGWGGEVLERTS